MPAPSAFTWATKSESVVESLVSMACGTPPTVTVKVPSPTVESSPANVAVAAV